jgi:hypothetical protein
VTNEVTQGCGTLNIHQQGETDEIVVVVAVAVAVAVMVLLLLLLLSSLCVPLVGFSAAMYLN